MKSPFTGKEMLRKFEPSTWRFRGEDIPYIKEYWECVDTGERFTTTAGDSAGFLQVTNHYRYVHGIPFTDEIINLRKRYEISAVKMSKILGMGDNQYRNYENGDVPNESNGKLIRSVFNPLVMSEMLNSSPEILTTNGARQLIKHLDEIISQKERNKRAEYEENRVFQVDRGPLNGFAPRSLERLKNLLFYILGKVDHVWTTKMNKILFYIDFVSYRDRGVSISGLSYRALDFGPVPDRWDRIYSEFDEIFQVPTPVRSSVGMVLITEHIADLSLFSPEEIQVIDSICEKLGNMSVRHISELSHIEYAWQKKQGDHAQMDFQDAFWLRAL